MKKMIYRIRGKLSRLLAVKAPNFKNQAGSYEFPDVVLNGPNNPPPPPRPLINNNCKKYHVIYSVVANNVLGKCTFRDKVQALIDAYQQALDYFENHFECRNKCCIRKEGEIIWMGCECWKDPDAAAAAIEVRFHCKVEL
ncbi:MAG: hypothetical protein JKY19_08885 [Alcanivoracaceae bacterium]|nr:hypothetical protein [Alcanivoracaceae bacterium]